MAKNDRILAINPFKTGWNIGWKLGTTPKVLGFKYRYGIGLGAKKAKREGLSEEAYIKKVGNLNLLQAVQELLV